MEIAAREGFFPLAKSACTSEQVSIFFGEHSNENYIHLSGGNDEFRAGKSQVIILEFFPPAKSFTIAAPAFMSLVTDVAHREKKQEVDATVAF